MDAFDCDVAVIGAGPAGLTAAGDLARAARSVVVLERRAEPSRASRAFTVQPRTLELLDSRAAGGASITRQLLALGSPVRRVELWPGATLRLDADDTPYPFTLVIPQTVTDALLADYAAGHGARIRRGHEVTGLQPGEDGVTLTVRTSGDGTVSRLRARWVIAADGAHSTARELLSIPFPGRTVLSGAVLADVRLANPPAGGALTIGTRDPGCFGFLAPFGDGWYRSMTWTRGQPPQAGDISPAALSGVLARSTGRDSGVTAVRWSSRFDCDERQISQYRHGRVFFAGDAAHVHSPAGGQGMNTGIQDAVNLAWKLDAVLGGAPAEILDSYQAERHPAGRRAVRSSGAMMRSITLRGALPRAIRDHAGSWLVARPAVARAMTGSLSGTALRYPRRRGQHPLTGTSAARVALDGAGRGDGTGFVLARPPGAAPADAGQAAAPAGRWLVRAQRRDDGPWLLIRPDGYIAWAGDGDGWRTALAAWLGAAAGPGPRPAAAAPAAARGVSA